MIICMNDCFDHLYRPFDLAKDPNEIGRGLSGEAGWIIKPFYQTEQN